MEKMKKTLRCLSLISLLSMIFVFAFAASAGAYSLSFTDIVGDSLVTYTLDLTAVDPDGSQYTAEFTISTSQAPSPTITSDADGDDAGRDWYAGFVAFNFGGKFDASIDPEDAPPPSGWGVASQGTEVLWPGQDGEHTQTPFNANRVGFYANLDPNNIDNMTNTGLSLAADAADTTFTFDLNLDPKTLAELSTESSEDALEAIGFKVGYYSPNVSNNKKSGNTKPAFQFDQLSEEISVPEPAVLLLLGSGLVGLGLLGRKLRKN